MEFASPSEMELRTFCFCLLSKNVHTYTHRYGKGYQIMYLENLKALLFGKLQFCLLSTRGSKCIFV